MYRYKTISLDLLLPRLLELVDLDLINLHSLQVGPEAEEFKKYQRPERVFDWNGVVKTFADTAYVISQLDLIISVDIVI